METDHDRLVGYLSKALGESKARAVVMQAAAAASVDLSRPLTREHALAILEAAAAEPGLVGITARFAKSRAAMQTWGADSKSAR